MTTGERIKNRRKELGISAEKLAKRLGISPAFVYRYENGGIEKVPGAILQPISEILLTTPAYLMGWEKGLETEKDTGKADVYREQLIHFMDSISEGDQQKVLAVLQALFPVTFK